MMDLLWAPVGDAYTLGPGHQEVKQTGVFPQHVFLVAVTEDLFYFSKHRIRPSSLDCSFNDDQPQPRLSNPGGPLRSDSNLLGKRGGLESGGSLFVLSENLSQRFSSGLSYQGLVRGDAEDELFGGGCPDRALAVSRDLLFSRQIIPDGSEKCPGFVDVRFYCLIR